MARTEQYKSTAEAAQDAARVILRQCADSETVKRVIHTGSMVACSPLKEDSTGFKDAVDESCWTPLDVDYPLRDPQFHVRACAATPERILIETSNLSRHSPRRRR